MTRLERLRKRRDFLRVGAYNKSRVCPAFILQVCPSDAPETGISRVGFTASRKIGGAVERNRGKRRLRALAQQIPGLIPEAPPLDFVFIARKAILSREFTALEKDLRWALNSLLESLLNEGTSESTSAETSS